MTDMTDIENYIARMALGDQEAFSALYRATSAKLFGMCLHVLGKQAEAEDALQAVFVKFWRNADRYQDSGLGPMAWLVKITCDQAVEGLCARRAKQALAASNGRAGMDDLPPDRADTLCRAYLEGETFPELTPSVEVGSRIQAALFGAQRKPRSLLERLGSRPLAFSMMLMALTVLLVLLQARQ